MAGTMAQRSGWSQLGGRARAWRAGHAAWSIAQLASLTLIWNRVLRRRRDPGTWGAAAFIAIEGVALVIGKGSCPMGRLQEEWGDPVPLFELVLPPRAAKAAIPVLAVVSVLAIAGLVVRAPGGVLRSEAKLGLILAGIGILLGR